MLGTGLMFELIVTRALASIIVDFLCLLWVFFLVRHDCSKTGAEKILVYFLRSYHAVSQHSPLLHFQLHCGIYPRCSLFLMSMKVNVYYVLP
jgi:hypothetical protein